MAGSVQDIRIDIVENSSPWRFPPAPPGRRLYAIGDVHGRDDLLAALLAAIRADAADAGAGDNLLVGLGDYIDRGPDSAAVLERLSHLHWDDFAFVPLKGNHEHLMLRFLEAPDEGGPWLANGGAATLASYGVPIGTDPPERARYAGWRDALDRALPAHHRRFLASLALSHDVGDYLFVHAGIRPGIPLAAQSDQDLIWIRGAFLNATENFGRLVVHGHSIELEPDLRPNRIGIDTGAFATGRLTAVAISGDQVRFLTACGASW